MEMSAPITMLASMSSSSPPLYVPIHKRTRSSASSSSSRSSSPSSTLSSDTPSPFIYSAATLLSLRPFADESMKAKMHITCPEVVMSRKMRKGLEFTRRTELLAAQQLQMQASAALAFGPSDADTNATPTPPQASTPALLRVQPGGSRPAGRAPERKRNVFSSESQAGLMFGSRRGLNTKDDSWRLQAMPISSVLVA